MYPTQLDLDRNITTLRINSSDLANMSNAEMVSLLNQMIENIKGAANYWVKLSGEKKGILHKHKVGEEWLGGPFASIIALQYYIEYLENKSDLDVEKYDEVTNSYKVFPNKFIEKLTFPFIDAKVYFNKSMSFDDINKFRGFSKRYDIDPSITLVLGAGNFSSIPYLDVLYHLITRRSVILLKLNPVNDYLKPVFEKVFQNFIERGYVIVSTGNVDESKYMANHQGVDHIHLTGSDKTFEEIVYGRHLNDKERKLKNLPKLNTKNLSLIHI